MNRNRRGAILSWLIAPLAATLAIAASPGRAAAQAELVGGLGGPAGFGQGIVSPGDDNSAGPINITQAFPGGITFLGSTFTSLFINTNGNITFNGPFASFVPTRLPVANQPMIAPWWADVDTSGLSGEVDNTIYHHVDRVGRRAVVTWHQVGFFDSQTHRVNSFQVIIADRSEDFVAGDFDVEFRYNLCQWTSGQFSGGDANGLGGTPAQAGFDAGDGDNFTELPGSFTPEVLDLCTLSNVDDPGVWRFQIRNGGVTQCGNGVREGGEQCDEGDANGNDGCSPDCLLEVDPDGDGLFDPFDNCGEIPNLDQADLDRDGLGDPCDACPLDPDNDQDQDGVCGEIDNCPADANDDQRDSDDDDSGDVCDVCPLDPDDDLDEDTICGDVDNCALIPNRGQEDGDRDNIGDLCDACPLDFNNDGDRDGLCANVDNCPLDTNADQRNRDFDRLGDVCDACPLDLNNDRDTDGVCGDVDNCPNDTNADQADLDLDDLGDVCDRCPGDADNDLDRDNTCGDVDTCPDIFNPDQADGDRDGVGNACDACPADSLNDPDADDICGNVDNCPRDFNPQQEDLDRDGIGNACDACPLDLNNDRDTDSVCGDVDNCPNDTNADQANVDRDNLGDLCDACPLDFNNDGDRDGLCANVDNCPLDANADQLDGDDDGSGDVCDDCPIDPDNDRDEDGICGEVDNCPGQSNADQSDVDEDGLGDVCDPCPLDGANDGDQDTVCDSDDNCPGLRNADQLDADDDGSGDACDACPLDSDDDVDDDGVCGDVDNCLEVVNEDQADLDLDSIGDLCDPDLDGDAIGNEADNCPNVSNSPQTDTDGDGIGDDCEDDFDGDDVLDGQDNCPQLSNPDQADLDEDGLGDACDVDQDGDDVPNDEDICPDASDSDQTNTDGDDLGDACDDDDDDDGFLDVDEPEGCSTLSNGFNQGCPEGFGLDLRGSGLRCATSPASPASPSLPALLGLAALLLLATRRRLLRQARCLGASLLPLALVALCLPLLPTQAQAQSSRFELQRFRPATSQRIDYLSAESGESRLTGDFEASVFPHLSFSPLIGDDADGEARTIIDRQLVSNLSVAYSPDDFLRIALDLPIYALQSGDEGGFNANPGDFDASGIGDLRVVPKLTLLERSEGLALAFLIPSTVALGDASRFQSEGFRVEPTLAIDATSGSSWGVAANLGYLVRDNARFNDLVVDDQITYKLAARTPAFTPEMHLVAELTGAISPLNGGLRVQESPLEGLVALRYNFGASSLTFGGGAGILAGVGAPLVRTFVGYAYSPDYESSPPDLENDAALTSNTITSNRVAAPDRRTDSDSKGGPAGGGLAVGGGSGDRDSDGITDLDDVCPTKPEDKDGHRDEDGCPDDDNDNDGVLDAQDKCPGDPEDRDRFQDEDGCPDTDDDKDGVADLDDLCPRVPGIAASNGCPAAARNSGGGGGSSAALQGLDIVIFFDFNSSDLDANAKAQLTRLARFMTANPEIGLVGVYGHTDAVSTETRNQALSESRARNTIDHLVSLGVARDRFKIQGFGEKKPNDSNDTSEGRQQNRRVEFEILQR